jgi:outer membrane protein assembly factor BamA
VELRIDVWGPLGIEIYADAGNVWDNPSQVGLGSFSPAFSSDPMTPYDVRWVYGFGPRFQLPFGPLRMDFTWWARPDDTGKRQRGTFQFAIGPSF